MMNDTNTPTDKKKKTHNLSNKNTAKKRYLVASKRGTVAIQSGVKPLSSFELKEHINRFSDAKVHKTLVKKKTTSAQSLHTAEAQECHVVEMSDDTHQELKNNSPEHVIIEEDQHLDFLDGKLIPTLLPNRSQSLSAVEKTSNFSLMILGEDDKPLEGVDIAIQSGYNKGVGVSNKKGEVSVRVNILDNKGIDSIFVKKKTGYWDFFLKNPELSTTELNVIRLKSLAETIPGFPENFRRGWGERFMGFDGQHEHYTGKGIKIGIIDTGAGEHPLLSHLSTGVDLSSSQDTTNWRTDTEGHGTHVAGVITAKGNANQLRGFCPDAEIVVLKVFPGGTTSSLVEAIDTCIDEGVDVINMSLGTPNTSLVVEQKIEEAVLSGIGLIVAAGNSGSAVQFPANSPNTLAVSAIGAINQVQENTWDASQISANLTLNNGVFSPLFSCFGPEVDVTAPGVSIVSTGPDGTYFPDSGTSMAAPHVTGMAGLLLAHHPIFQTLYKEKNHTRVAALYELLKTVSIPYNFGPGRTGSGMPSAYSVAQQLTHV